MQLLSLASLAVEQRELPYERVAEALQIKPEEVEHWVISAIGAKLIDAKMDQLRRLVIVTYVLITSHFARYDVLLTMSLQSLCPKSLHQRTVEAAFWIAAAVAQQSAKRSQGHPVLERKGREGGRRCHRLRCLQRLQF